MSCYKIIEAGISTCPELQDDSGISEIWTLLPLATLAWAFLVAIGQYLTFQKPTVKKASSQAGSSMPKHYSEVSLEHPREKLEASRAVNQNRIRFEELLRAVESDDASAVQDIIRNDRNLINVKNKSLENTPLHHAAARKCVGVVKELLAAGANPCCTNSLGQTPLHVALEWGSEDIAELMSNYGACQNSLPDTDGNTPLHFAALKGCAGVARKLLAAGANTRYLDRRRRTPLHIALEYWADNIAELISDVDPGNSVQDTEGRTPLHLAAKKGCLGIVRKLLAAGVSTRLQDKWGSTPLHRAVEHGSFDIVQLIWDADREIILQNKHGFTPLHYAAKYGYTKIVRILANDASKNLQDEKGFTPLHYAVINGYGTVVKMLLAAGASTRLQDGKGKTPLHVAIKCWEEAKFSSGRTAGNILRVEDWGTLVHHPVLGFEGVVRKILYMLASTRDQDNWGSMPFQCAVQRELGGIVELLHDADPENSLQDNRGNTPLHLAAMQGNADIARKLLFSAAHPFLKNKEGDSPLAIALTSNKQDIMKVIISMCSLRDIAVNWRNLPDRQENLQYCMKLVADCEEEIQLMKETKVHSSTISYYDVARKHERKVAEYLRNNDVRNVLLDGNTLRSFPNYAEFITFKVGKAEMRRILNEQCFEHFAFLSRLPSLPLICIEIILTFLKELEMQNLIEAFTSCD